VDRAGRAARYGGRWGAHGGDVGSLVGRELGVPHPEGLIGTHVTQIFAFPSGDPEEFAKLDEEGHRRLAVTAKFREQNTVPTGVAVFPHDFLSVRTFAERANNIVHWSEFEEGGHFSAMEKPELLTQDIRAFFRGLR
jgi:hypothetical protein